MDLPREEYFRSAREAALLGISVDLLQIVHYQLKGPVQPEQNRDGKTPLNQGGLGQAVRRITFQQADDKVIS